MSRSFGKGWEWIRIWASASCFALVSEEAFIVLGVQDLREVSGFDGGKHSLEASSLDGVTGDAPIGIDVNVINDYPLALGFLLAHRDLGFYR